MCATCYWCILDRCISLASKARESNFYTTLWTHRCAGEFSSSCPCRIEERAKGKRWMVMPLCRQTRGISLSRIERVESSEGEGRGRATLSPCLYLRSRSFLLSQYEIERYLAFCGRGAGPSSVFPVLSPLYDAGKMKKTLPHNDASKEWYKNCFL